MGNKPNLEAAFFAVEHDLLMTVGSDAHTLDELGAATLFMPYFQDTESFKASLPSAEQMTEHTPFYTHFFSTYAKILKKFERIFSHQN
jgi:hypothetical protein